MLKGKTAGGFSFKISEETRDDMELLENILLLDSGEANVLPRVLNSLLGEEQKKKLYDFCRGKSGRVSATRVMQEVKAIFDAIKNSEDDTKN